MKIKEQTFKEEDLELIGKAPQCPWCGSYMIPSTTDEGTLFFCQICFYGITDLGD